MPMSEAELAAAQGLADAEVAISDDNFGGEAVQAKAHDSKFNLAEEEEGAPAPAAEPLANPRDIAAQRLAAAEAGGPMARPATPSKKPGEGCDMEMAQSAADRAREFRIALSIWLFLCGEQVCSPVPIVFPSLHPLSSIIPILRCTI